LSLDQVRGSIGTNPSSANTLHVSGSSRDPQVAARVARATIDGFIQWVIDASISDSTAAEKFLNELAESYKRDCDAASAALEKFLLANPQPVVGTLPADKLSELARLQSEVETVGDRYHTTLSKAEDARLNSAQARSNVEGRLRLVDAPTVPTTSTFSRVKLVMQLALFTFLGVALSGVAVFVGTITNKSLRTADEIRDRLGVPLLAIIPESRFAAMAARADLMADAPPGRRRLRRTKSKKEADKEQRQHTKDQYADA
jgi:hypothetical protein